MAQKKVKNTPILVKKIPSVSIIQNSLYWYVLGILIVSIGLVQAINLRWVSEDAFITFRYVKNFVEGHGIVYNLGEYVEGYTHFLWLLILSAAKFIGFDAVEVSMNLGIAAYAAILVIYMLISKNENQQRVKSAPIKFYLPLAAILLALNYDMNVWASGGLETSLYTLFISLAFYLWFYSSIQEKKKVLTVGSILRKNCPS